MLFPDLFSDFRFFLAKDGFQSSQLLLPVFLQLFSILQAGDFTMLNGQLSFYLTFRIELNLHHCFSINPFHPQGFTLPESGDVFQRIWQPATTVGRWMAAAIG